MTTPGKSIRTKILVPIFMLVTGITAVLLLIIFDVSHNVAKKYFEFVLSSHSAEVVKILDTAVTELISARLLDNKAVTEEKQKVSIEDISEYWKRNGLLGIISRADGTVLHASVESGLQSQLVPLTTKSGPFHVEVRGDHINGYTADFPAWGWKVVTISRPVLWLVEMHRRETAFLLPVVILGMGMIFVSIIFILQHNFRRPMKNMLSDLAAGGAIGTTGISELDVIAGAMNDAISRLQGKTRQLETLHDVSISLYRQSRDEAIGSILDKVGRLFASELSAFLLSDGKGGIRRLFARGAVPTPDRDLPEGKGILDYLVRASEPLLINDVAGHPAFSGSFPEGHPVIRNIISTHVVFGDRHLGTLLFGNKPGGFAPDDEILLRAVAADMAIAVIHAQNLIQLERFREVINSSFNIVMITDDQGIIAYVNPACEKITGYAPLDLIGNRFDLLFGQEDRGLPKTVWDTAAEGKTWQGEFRNRRKDGDLYHVSAVFFPLRGGEGTIYASIQRDITHEKVLYEQLLRSQKLEAVGTLAGGVAHDFNNMLTAIIGYASLLSMKLEADNTLKPLVNQILSSAEKSANLTQQLLAFSRKQVISPRQRDINDLLRGTEKLLRRVIGEDIEFRTSLSGEPLTVMIDSGQIEQVIVNLCTNARDAMPGGGILSISTARTYLDSDFARANDLERPGMHAVISVSDTGMGMDEKTRVRIFEPFFTTKEVGKGTGLGLSIVYGVIRQHGGTITVYSERGAGTSFKIYLPLLSGTSEELPPAAEVAPPQRGTETILIAEDNDDVRGLTIDILERYGYTVIESRDGEDALRKFMEDPDRAQLILLDVIMPKKNGRELWEEVRKIRPGIKVIFMSGYTGDILNQKGVIEEGVEFIQKPLSPHDLLSKIRTVLDTD